MAQTGKSKNSIQFLPEPGLIMIVGNYGSGKTEVSVNLAIQWATAGHRVQIADLDIVNPYFRCREAQELMRSHQIRVVVPPGAQTWADLPIVVPEIQGMLSPDAPGFRLFDVGGDAVGARLLSSLAARLADHPYQLWQVINARRPFTDSLAGCLKMMEAIEQASRLRVSGLIANTHLVSETDLAVILEGWELTRQVAERSGRPVVCVTAMGELARTPGLARLPVPILALERHMLPPWLKPAPTESNLPASRSVPIGRPPGVK
jgi:hypothetical protein